MFLVIYGIAKNVHRMPWGGGGGYVPPMYFSNLLRIHQLNIFSVVQKDVSSSYVALQSQINIFLVIMPYITRNIQTFIKK